MPDNATTELLLTADAAPAPAQPSAMSPIVMLAIFFAIFWFLVIRPQRRAQSDHAKLLNALKKGDKVVTDGGLLGTVWQVEDQRVVLDFGDKTRIAFLKSSVKGLQFSGEAKES